MRGRTHRRFERWRPQPTCSIYGQRPRSPEEARACPDYWGLNHADAFHAGNQFGKQFHQLGTEIDRNAAEASDIASRSRQTGDESRSNRVSDSYHDDGNCGRCAASRIHRRRGPCDDDINIAVNKLSHGTGIVLECSLRPANVDGQILPFNVAALAHTITERAQHGRHRRYACENPDAPDLRLLSARRERPPCCCATEQQNELAPSHSITTS